MTVDGPPSLWRWRLLAVIAVVAVAVQAALIFRVVTVQRAWRAHQLAPLLGSSRVVGLSEVDAAVMSSMTGRLLAFETPMGKQTLMRADCVASGKGGKAVGSTRDCEWGQSFACSREQPCTPCGPLGSHAAACVRCDSARAAALATTPGSCAFIDSVGPYCTFAANTTGPCTRCCA